MHIKEGMVKTSSRTVLLILILVVFIPALFLMSGCKGKEEQQTAVPQTEQPSGQQAKEGLPVTQAPAPSQQPAPEQQTGKTHPPPRITSVDISPQYPVAGDKIKATVGAYDDGGERVNLTYQWTKNNIPLSETSDTLTVAKDFNRGDKITLKIIPDNGKLTGTPVTMLLTIANAPPQILPSQETFNFDGNVYSYQVKAIDPDGDTLTYTLKSAPPGMTINPSTGLIQWNVPSSFKGKAAITVAVSDGNGGEVMQSFSLQIRPQQK
jgi:hypothetical protein